MKAETGACPLGASSIGVLLDSTKWDSWIFSGPACMNESEWRGSGLLEPQRRGCEAELE